MSLNTAKINSSEKALIPLPPTHSVIFFCAKLKVVQSELQPLLAAELRSQMPFAFCVRFCKKMQNHCTGNGPFLSMFPAIKPNGNRRAPFFSESERFVYFFCVRDELRANRKRAGHMDQCFQPDSTVLVGCICFRVGALRNCSYLTTHLHSI